MSKGRDLPEFPQFYNTRIHSSPDGQDCLLKTLHTAKVYGLLGAWLSFYDIIAVSKSSSVMLALGRTAVWAGPLAGAGAVYAGSSCLLGSIRHKDGPLNHGIAGALAGTVLGTATRNPNLGIAAILFLGAGCSGLKYLRNQGFTLIPERKTMNPTSTYVSYSLPTIGQIKATEPTDY